MGRSVFSTLNIPGWQWVIRLLFSPNSGNVLILRNLKSLRILSEFWEFWQCRLLEKDFQSKNWISTLTSMPCSASSQTQYWGKWVCTPFQIPSFLIFAYVTALYVRSWGHCHHKLNWCDVNKTETADFKIYLQTKFSPFLLLNHKYKSSLVHQSRRLKLKLFTQVLIKNLRV